MKWSVYLDIAQMGRGSYNKVNFHSKMQKNSTCVFAGKKDSIDESASSPGLSNYSQIEQTLFIKVPIEQ